MRTILCVILVLGLVAILGCAQEKPEAAAKKIFEAQVAVAGHEGVEMDTSGLVYKMVEKSETNALVEVSGKMAVKAAIPLVKEKGQWVLAVPTGDDTEEEAAAHKRP